MTRVFRSARAREAAVTGSVDVMPGRGRRVLWRTVAEVTGFIAAVTLAVGVWVIV